MTPVPGSSGDRVHDDRFELLPYRSGLSHDREESLDDVEKSSHVLEQALAVLSILRPDGSEPRAVLEESRHVVLQLRAVVSGSTDVRSESRA
jgi:hypothetical protein